MSLFFLKCSIYFFSNPNICNKYITINLEITHAIIFFRYFFDCLYAKAMIFSV